MLLGFAMVAGLGVWAKAVATPPDLRFTDIAVFPVNPANSNLIHNVNNRLGREVELDFVRAGRFTVLLDLVNEGNRKVRIHNLPDDAEWSEAMYTSPALHFDRRRPEGVGQPFQAMALSPGESITVLFTFSFPDTGPRSGCLLSPNQTTELPVTYRKLGFRRTRWMPLDGSLLSSFNSARCDEKLQPVRPS